MRVRPMRAPHLALGLASLLAGCFVLTAPIGAVAQGVALIAGVVVDEVSGEAVAGATVSIEAAGIEIQTRKDGTFGWFELPEGTASVRIAAPGRLTVVDEIVLDPEEPSLVQVVLSEIDVVLADLLVRGSADEETIQEFPSSMTAAELVARAVPGSGVQRSGFGAESDTPHIRLRGSNSFNPRGEPLVFLNGVRLGGVGGVLEQLRTIPATDVESVTVLMGPAAAFLHAMASDGAILVETK